MTSTNIYRYWIAVAGTYLDAHGKRVNRRPCALVYASQELEKARDHLRTLIAAREYEGDTPPVLVELDPPQKKSGARVGETAVRELLDESRIVAVTDADGSAATLPGEIQKLCP